MANSKGNGYQSIHTAVIGPGGRIVEIQIRTHEMQEFAENGVAAHWRYKEGSQQDQAMEQTIVGLRRLLENMDDSEGFLEDLHAELFSEQVYVMSPKGDVVTLIQGATPVDFAYAIHTEVGHCCRGAKVDGRSVSLTYALKSGERVEIITSERARPSREWMEPHLGYLKSSRSRAKVRYWFNQQTSEAQIKEGQKIYQDETLRLGLGEVNQEALLHYLTLSDVRELWMALGSAKLTSSQLVKALSHPDVATKVISAFEGIESSETAFGEIEGVGHLKTHLAKCCQPVKGDPIIGWVTEENEVVIHRHDCKPGLAMLEDNQQHLVEVKWGQGSGRGRVHVHIDAFDRKRLLSDITDILTKAEINTLEVNTRTDTDDQSVTMDLLIEVLDTEQLSLVLDKMNMLPNVFSARRLG
ncbi:MAG: GTP pyrophosphokinase (EC, (p)ppGpp synthetase I [uncultured Thiotrichaceae bacterium]|uniref:GTP pyrophosphokinase n=1 Tax=uncultured Thiotrichaceae bacterium TaxID=298394 RepID=A0A6S6TUK5_9GAMM|nr:MAG: GTP pyrophosphokinase (EC, (p)ppGpp synthetase I [uncultured Thiotrichaceae bacterium]